MLKQQTGRSPNLARAGCTGVMTSLVTGVLGTGVLAKLVDAEFMKLENLGYGIMILHLLSVFLGARSAMGRGGHRANAAAGITAGGYYLCLLLVNGLFFGGNYTGLGVTLVLSLLAAVGAIGIGRKGRGRAHRKRYKIPK